MSLPSADPVWDRLLTECVAPVLPGAAPAADDNLFDAGADSLTLLALIARVQESFGVEIDPVAVFAEPTPAALAAAVRAAVDARDDLQATARAEVSGMSDDEVSRLLAELMADDAAGGRR